MFVNFDFGFDSNSHIWLTVSSKLSYLPLNQVVVRVASKLHSSSTFLLFRVQLLESLNCFYTGELECRFKTFHSFDWHHFIRRFASTAWTQLLDFHSSNHSLLVSDSSHVLRGRYLFPSLRSSIHSVHHSNDAFTDRCIGLFFLRLDSGLSHLYLFYLFVEPLEAVISIS